MNDRGPILIALLFSVIPEAREVLSLEPEDLSGILLELVPRVPEAPRFLISSFTQEGIDNRRTVRLRLRITF